MSGIIVKQQTTEAGPTWVVKLKFEQIREREIVKSSGFRWDSVNKQWFTVRPESAKALIAHLDAEQKAAVAAALAALDESKRAAVDASRAATSEVALVAPAGLDYLPYQKAGISIAMNRKVVLIGDEMGLGKTVQGLGLLNQLPSSQAFPALIVCPASLRQNWFREASRWLVDRDGAPPTVAIWKSVKDDYPVADVVIASYEAVAKADGLPGRSFRVLIADEAHYLKSRQSNRTQAVMDVRADRVVFLSGTPMLNRPEELYPLLQRARLPWVGKWMEFAKRYCDAKHGKWGWETDGASNLAELEANLRATFMVRRLKADVLRDLPAKRRQVYALDLNGAGAKLVREERKAKAAVDAIDEAIKAATSKEERAALLAERTAAAKSLSDARKAVALAKLPDLVEQVEELRAAGEPVLIWTYHHDVTDAVLEALAKHRPVRCDGRDSADARSAAVAAFQGGQVDVIVAGVTAMGVGHTLTRASTALFLELDWVPANLMQAEDRLHRIGQERSVLVRYLVLTDSIDEQVAGGLDKKADVTSRALDGVIGSMLGRAEVVAAA